MPPAFARLLMAVLVALAALAGVRPAAAHLTPNSEARLAFGPHHVAAEIVIPLGDYAAASGNPTDNGAASLERANEYLRRHVAAVSPDGAPWTLAIERLRFETIAGPPDLHATARLMPPPGASPRRLVLRWSAVVDRVPNHFVLVVADGDFAGGLMGEERQVLGALRASARVLAIDRGTAGPFAGFAAAIRLGMTHIAEGHDHLLFLLALLLPAPVMAVAGRWGPARPPRATMSALALIVTAFTLGHSVTLVGAALFAWRLPAQPVEVLIAISILVSAVHAWRPIFPGREALVAGGFGLIHGLAFATVVSGYGLDTRERALAILGFNLGIELVQLGVVAAIMPSLVLLARTPAYPPIRTLGAGFAGVAACAWAVERIAEVANPVAGAADLLLSHGPWLIAALFLLAVMASARPRRLFPTR